MAEQVDAGAEAELPKVAGGGEAEIAAEETDEVLGGNVGGGGEVLEADGPIEMAAGELLGGFDGGVGREGGGEAAGDAGLVDVEHEAADDEGEEGGLGGGLLVGAGGDGDVKDGGVEAFGGDGEGLDGGGGVEVGHLAGGEGVGDSGDPGLEAGLTPDLAAMGDVLGAKEDGVAGGDVALGSSADADEGLAGVDAEDVVGGAEGHTTGFAGLHDDAAEPGAPVRIRRRHLVAGDLQVHGGMDINFRTVLLKRGDCGPGRAAPR